MKPIAPEAVFHDTARRFIDDFQFTLAHNVMFVPTVQVKRRKRLSRQFFAHQGTAPNTRKRRKAFLRTRATRLGQNRKAMFAGNAIIDIRLKLPCKAQNLLDHLTRNLRLRLRRNDKRRACLINEHAVGLINNGKVQSAQTHVAPARGIGQCPKPQTQVTALLTKDHPVTQIIESQFLVGAIDDIGPIGLLPLRQLLACDDHTNAQAQSRVKRRHRLGIASRKIIIDRDDMNRESRECCSRCSQGRCQRLAFASRHMRNHAFKKCMSPHDLDVVRTFSGDALASFAQQGKGFGKSGFILHPGPPELQSRLSCGQKQIAGRQLTRCIRLAIHAQNDLRQKPRPTTGQGRHATTLHGLQKLLQKIRLCIRTFRIKRQRHCA